MNRNIALGVMAGMVSVLLFSVVAVGSFIKIQKNEKDEDK